MSRNKFEQVIPMREMPANLQRDCLFPKIVVMFTYREKGSRETEIINVMCKSRICLNSLCPLKDFTDFK